MFRPRIKNATRVLLAALVLTAGIAPPALRHSHALEQGVDIHHRHDANHDAGDGHVHHGDCGKHPQSASQQSDAGLFSDHRWHLHFHFLFFEFTLPDPVPDQDDREPCGRDTVSVLSLTQVAVSCKAPQTASAWQTIPPSHVVSPEDAALLQVVVTAPPPVSCPPLCDRARRERSGVLIA